MYHALFRRAERPSEAVFSSKSALNSTALSKAPSRANHAPQHANSEPPRILDAVGPQFSSTTKYKKCTDSLRSTPTGGRLRGCCSDSARCSPRASLADHPRAAPYVHRHPAAVVAAPSAPPVPHRVLTPPPLARPPRIPCCPPPTLEAHRIASRTLFPRAPRRTQPNHDALRRRAPAPAEGRRLGSPRRRSESEHAGTYSAAQCQGSPRRCDES